MDAHGGQIDPQRLMEAVDAIYRANAEQAAEGGLSVYPTDLMGTIAEPEAFRDFTAVEIDEAARFLVRMGLIVRREGPCGRA